MIEFSPVCIIRRFFLIPLRWRIRQILLYLQYYGTTQAMWRIRSNVQILLDCIAMNGIFKKYYYITFTCSISCVTFWCFQSDLASDAKFGVLSLELGFKCLGEFLGVSSEDLGFLGFYCLPVIEDRVWLIAVLISSPTFFILLNQGTSLFSITDGQAIDTM